MYPEAVKLADAGWLERRHVDATGDWAGSGHGRRSTALNIGPLRRDQPGGQN